MSDHIHPVFERMLQRKEREAHLGQKSSVFWLTGLSGSGKSTLAVALERRLFEQGYFAQVLDGDNIRSGINNNLGFSMEDRRENIRRIAEVSKLYIQSGIVVIASFISPTIEIRNYAKRIISEDDFHEIFVDAPLEVCEKRDVKGLYAKARSGEIKGFTGIDAPYEAPQEPSLHLKTDEMEFSDCLDILLNFAIEKTRLT